MDFVAVDFFSIVELFHGAVKVGQKASLTFDAVDGLTMTGKVSEVDAIGSASQGVVNYTVKIVFDTQDERVKSGMSANAVIIIDTKMDALVVPSSSVKTSDGITYVEVPSEKESFAGVAASTLSNGVVLANSIIKQQVEIGSSSDSLTEIVNGLEEVDKIITKIIQSSEQTTATKTSTNSSINLMRMTGGSIGGGGGPPSGM